MSMNLPKHLRHNQRLLTLYQHAVRQKMWHTAAGVVADTCGKVLELEQKESATSESIEGTKQSSEEWLALVETLHQIMRVSIVPFSGTGLMTEFSGSNRGAFTEWLADWIRRGSED
jgi:hypothetical protein